MEGSDRTVESHNDKSQRWIIRSIDVVEVVVVVRGVWELKREGGLHPILSPTKMKVRQNSFDCLSFCSSSCLSASLSACLPVFLPFYLPYGLSCFPIFFLFPLFPSFFLEIYSPTPFTVRRQGGLLDPPDPPSQTPLTINRSTGMWDSMATWHFGIASCLSRRK